MLTKTIDVQGVGERRGQRITSRSLAEIVGARYEELFTLVQAELRRSGFEDLIAAGIVLTGGAAKVPGAVDLAHNVFQMPVRLGCPQGFNGMAEIVDNPIYATGVGLLQYAHHQQREPGANMMLGDGVKGVWSRMRSWFHGNF